MEGQSGLSELSTILWVSAVQGCPAGFHCKLSHGAKTADLVTLQLTRAYDDVIFIVEG